MVQETEEVNAEHESGTAFLDLLPDTPQKYLGLYNDTRPQDSKTATLTVTAASSNASSSSSSGGGGGGTNATTNATKETKLFSTTAGASKLLTFTQSAVTEIELKTATSKTSVKLSVAESSKPSGAVDPISSAAGSTYKYVEITKSNVVDSDFSLIKIRFKVPKSWITSNGVDASKVYLARYVSGSWSSLSTTQTSSDGSYYYYDATSSGFSTFAVVGEKAAAAPGQPAPTPTPSPTPTPAPTPEQPSVPSLPGAGVAPPTLDVDANTLVGIVILILAVGFGIVYHYLLKGGKYKYKPAKEVYSSKRAEKQRYEYKPGK
jgi:PGF-pre-PGF domain-containing protein